MREFVKALPKIAELEIIVSCGMFNERDISIVKLLLDLLIDFYTSVPSITKRKLSKLLLLKHNFYSNITEEQLKYIDSKLKCKKKIIEIVKENLKINFFDQKSKYLKEISEQLKELRAEAKGLAEVVFIK